MWDEKKLALFELYLNKLYVTVILLNISLLVSVFYLYATIVSTIYLMISIYWLIKTYNNRWWRNN